jgi:hypothetical protein
LRFNFAGAFDFLFLLAAKDSTEKPPKTNISDTSTAKFMLKKDFIVLIDSTPDRGFW